MEQLPKGRQGIYVRTAKDAKSAKKNKEFLQETAWRLLNCLVVVTCSSFDLIGQTVADRELSKTTRNRHFHVIARSVATWQSPDVSCYR